MQARKGEGSLSSPAQHGLATHHESQFHGLFICITGAEATNDKSQGEQKNYR